MALNFAHNSNYAFPFSPYSPLSALNLSQLSLRVLNTKPAINRTSVFASCGNYCLSVMFLRFVICRGLTLSGWVLAMAFM